MAAFKNQLSISRNGQFVSQLRMILFFQDAAKTTQSSCGPSLKGPSIYETLPERDIRSSSTHKVIISKCFTFKQNCHYYQIKHDQSFFGTPCISIFKGIIIMTKPVMWTIRYQLLIFLNSFMGFCEMTWQIFV